MNKILLILVVVSISKYNFGQTSNNYLKNLYHYYDSAGTFYNLATNDNYLCAFGGGDHKVIQLFNAINNLTSNIENRIKSINDRYSKMVTEKEETSGDEKVSSTKHFLNNSKIGNNLTIKSLINYSFENNKEKYECVSSCQMSFQNEKYLWESSFSKIADMITGKCELFDDHGIPLSYEGINDYTKINFNAKNIDYFYNHLVEYLYKNGYMVEVLVPYNITKIYINKERLLENLNDENKK